MRILAVLVLSAASLAQNTVIMIPPRGGVIPPPDIAGQAGEVANSAQRAYQQDVETQRIQQQTKLLKQQTEAIKQQNALLKQQHEAALAAAQAPKAFIAPSELRKPRIDDIDAATGKPRFVTLMEYLDAKDEWLIAETLRRWEALHPVAPPQID